MHVGTRLLETGGAVGGEELSSKDNRAVNTVPRERGLDDNEPQPRTCWRDPPLARSLSARLPSPGVRRPAPLRNAGIVDLSGGGRSDTDRNKSTFSSSNFFRRESRGLFRPTKLCLEEDKIGLSLLLLSVRLKRQTLKVCLVGAFI